MDVLDGKLATLKVKRKKRCRCMWINTEKERERDDKQFSGSNLW